MSSFRAKAGIRLLHFAILTVPFAGPWTPVNACLMDCVAPAEIGGDKYVFSGEVVGSAGPLEIITGGGRDTAKPEWWGLQVRVVDLVSAPASAQRLYEVFPHSYGIDCDLLPIPPTALEQAYPPGTRVRIIGTLLSTSPYRARVTADSGSSIPRLEAASYCGRFARDRGYPEEWLTDGDVDYAQVSKPQSIDDSAALTFALVRDLSQLKSARTEKKKVAIIKRLIYYPFWTTEVCAQVVSRHLVDGESAQELMQQCATIHDRR